MATREQQIQALNKDWAENPRWKGIKRNYTAEEVVNLRGSVQIDHTLAKRGSEKLWNLLHTEPFVNALGALSHTHGVNRFVQPKHLWQLWTRCPLALPRRAIVGPGH